MTHKKEMFTPWGENLRNVRSGGLASLMGPVKYHLDTALLLCQWFWFLVLPSWLFHMNTKAFTDYAEIILIHHLTGFALKESSKKWVDVSVGVGRWLTQRQKAIGRRWGRGCSCTLWGYGK